MKKKKKGVVPGLKPYLLDTSTSNQKGCRECRDGTTPKLGPGRQVRSDGVPASSVYRGICDGNSRTLKVSHGHPDSNNKKFFLRLRQFSSVEGDVKNTKIKFI